MSTRYISAPLPPDGASTVLRVGTGGTQRCQQFAKLLVVGAAQPDGVVRSLTGGQQLKPVSAQLAGVGRYTVGKVANRRASSSSSAIPMTANTEMPSSGSPSSDQARARAQRVAAQLVCRVPAAAHNDRRRGQQLIGAQQLPLLNPLPWHAVRLLTGTVSLSASPGARTADMYPEAQRCSVHASVPDWSLWRARRSSRSGSPTANKGTPGRRQVTPSTGILSAGSGALSDAGVVGLVRGQDARGPIRRRHSSPWRRASMRSSEPEKVCPSSGHPGHSGAAACCVSLD